MNARRVLGACAPAAMALWLLSVSVAGQQNSLKEQFLGTWILVSHEAIRPDGSRAPVYGPNPNGIAFFDAGGHFIITAMRSDRAKYAITNPTQGTPEENQATAQGAITYFGTYTVSEAERRIAIHVEASSFPNWNGADQIRTFAIAGDQLTLGVVLQTGAQAEVVWKRAK